VVDYPLVTLCQQNLNPYSITVNASAFLTPMQVSDVSIIKVSIRFDIDHQNRMEYLSNLVSILIIWPSTTIINEQQTNKQT